MNEDIQKILTEIDKINDHSALMVVNKYLVDKLNMLCKQNEDKARLQFKIGQSVKVKVSECRSRKSIRLLNKVGIITGLMNRKAKIKFEDIDIGTVNWRIPYSLLKPVSQAVTAELNREK